MPKLAIILVDEYRSSDLDSGFQSAFEELGLDRVFHAGENILIKPNMLGAVSPDLAVTPHPSVFRSLALQLRLLGTCLSYGDSPAFESVEKAAKATGLAAVADALDIPLADFEGKVDRHLPSGRVLKTLPLARGAAEADGLVNLAKLKTHALTGITSAIKNLFGVVPGPRKPMYHATFPDLGMFCQMLVDVAACTSPRLSVLDAVVAMEGNGPRNGDPRKVGVILVSQDAVAVDAAAAWLIGLEPDSILTTRLAYAAGLGEMHLHDIEAVLIRPSSKPAIVRRGTADMLLEQHRVTDFKKALRWQSYVSLLSIISKPVMKRFILNRPVIIDSVCTRCGACVSSCPLDPKAVSQVMQDAMPAYDYNRCIRCCCCQEICPSGAIEIRRSLIGKILRI